MFHGTIIISQIIDCLVKQVCVVITTVSSIKLNLANSFKNAISHECKYFLRKVLSQYILILQEASDFVIDKL